MNYAGKNKQFKKPVPLQKNIMSVFLFDALIFGPVRSRRLGVSLGINLLPTHKKLCSFNCIYCECGWTKNRNALKTTLPSLQELEQALESKLRELQGTDMEPDSITFAGNGEPSLHPAFAAIVDSTLRLRDEYAPKAVVSVLSNGSMLHKPEIRDALKKVDNNLLKLDGGTEETIKKINTPLKAFRLEEYIRQLQLFNGNLTIQSLFLRGTHNGEQIDNTKPEELEAWLKLLKQIQPKHVMVYTIERSTAEENLFKVPLSELKEIVKLVEEAGFEASVFG